MNIFFKYALLLCLFMVGTSCSRESDTPPIPLVFNKSSDELKATVVVPTLDSPIPDGKNAIWCASFQAAWKALEQLVGGQVAFDPASPVAVSLNNAPDPRPQIPAESLYVAAAAGSSTIATQIVAELKQKFPSKIPPIFQGMMPESFIAYAYLEANLKFPRPYDQNEQPLTFTEAGGTKVEVNSFGILHTNHRGYGDKLFYQPCVMFRKGEPHEAGFEFAIDLCTNSSPSQIVVARIGRESTLAAALNRVEREVAAMASVSRSEAAWLRTLSGLDDLLIPDFHWAISHRFAQLEGNRFANERLKGKSLDIAQQDILFRLDRSGAALKSEAEGAASGFPTYLFFDRPFLVYMKKRGANMPYFAMWIDNAELLRPWSTNEVARAAQP